MIVKCVDKIPFETSSCIKPCSGLIVTSFSKSVEYKDLELLYPKILTQYNKYKIISIYPPGLIGRRQYFIMKYFLSSFEIHFSEYEWKNNLRFVRIYFHTPTIERITMEKAAKFVDMLSAIGGTMGLLTGFSIISAVEIIYFATKIVWNFIKNKKNKIMK